MSPSWQAFPCIRPALLICAMQSAQLPGHWRNSCSLHPMFWQRSTREVNKLKSLKGQNKSILSKSFSILPNDKKKRAQTYTQMQTQTWVLAKRIPRTEVISEKTPTATSSGRVLDDCIMVLLSGLVSVAPNCNIFQRKWSRGGKKWGNIKRGKYMYMEVTRINQS